MSYTLTKHNATTAIAAANHNDDDGVLFNEN